MTSLADLLDEIAPQAWSDLISNTADADDARRALETAAALLERLSDRLPNWSSATTTQRDRALTDVVMQCRGLPISQRSSEHGESERLDSHSRRRDADRGRLTELMAAASDLTSTTTPQLSAGERWAVCAALLDPVCACAAVLRETNPSASVVDLDRSLRRLRWWVTSCPPTGRDTARLDQARPSTMSARNHGPARLQQLIDAITYRVETSRPEPFEARVAAAAGLHVALYAKVVMTACAVDDAQTRVACDALTDAWFGLRGCLRDAAEGCAVDGSSDLLVHVADFAHQIVTTFGPVLAPNPHHGGLTNDEAITAFRGLVNRLPGLARGLAVAAGRWAGDAAYSAFDPATPIAWRDRRGVEHYAGIAPTRVPILVAGAVAERALDAARQSAVVAARADETAMRVGHQPHPNLIKAHIEVAATTTKGHDVPENRWQDIVVNIDARACHDDAWPMLARTLDHAAQTGWDVKTHLPALAHDLPTRQTALELTYRVLECCDIPATIGVTPETTNRGPISPLPERPALRPDQRVPRAPSR